MSVDIAQLTARLDSQRQEAVKQQYEERATSPTAAFLLCFFLGSAGAHRFYLREWRVAFAHLALFVAGVAALAVGLPQTLPLTTKLASHPTGAALDALGVALLLAALIWEIIDLGRIDHQVYQRNLLLAEGIIAGTLLADHTVVDEALQRLGATAQRAREQASAAAVPAPAPAAAAVAEAAPLAGAGIITANEVADARALAEETSGLSTISYAEMSRFDVSADPDQARQASADAGREGDWTERVTALESLPATTPESAPTTVAETVTRTHIEDGPRVTDSYEVDRVAGPSAAEAVGLGAAGLGAAALGAGLLAYESGAGFDEPTQPDAAASLAPRASAIDPTDTQPAPRAYAFDPTDGLTASAGTAASAATPEPAPALSAYPADAYSFDDDDIGDITDASMPAVVPSAADIGLAHASPAYVQLPEEPTARAEMYAPDASTEPEAPLYLIPDEPSAYASPYASPYGEEPAANPYSAYDAYDTYDASPSEEPPAEAYVPPVASVFSAPTEAPVTPTPSWDQPTTAQAAPESQPSADDTLAELAGFAGAAGAGALAGEALTHHHATEAQPAAAEPTPAASASAEPVTSEPNPAQTMAAEPVAPVAPVAPAPVAAAAPEPPKMKRIRVRRKVVVDGQVVAEEVVERMVPVDMDTAEAASQIQAELSHLTPEQIAQRAHLSPDEAVELRQRTEGPGGAQQ